jgi:peptidoglycan/LPS O-acetylase OafA/YrhL
MTEYGRGTFAVENKDAPAKGGRYYRPELDALRFAAFFCVFCSHRIDYVEIDPVWLARFGRMGSFGVQIFFLLSAFLITELLLRERERTGQVHIRAFYMRRILRIWPLYFLVFYGLAILNRFVPGAGTDSPRAWLAFTFFAGNWYIVHHGWLWATVDPLWSISVEEQFYIGIPVLAAFAGRRALVVVSLILLAVAYLTVVLYAIHPKIGDPGEWTNSFLQFQFFSAGTLLAVLLKGRLVRLSMPLRFAGFALAFCCWLTALIRFKVSSMESHPAPPGAIAGWLLILTGTVLFFLCTLGTPARFVPAWLSYLGRISYGLYLFHCLMFFLVFKQAMPLLAESFPAVHVSNIVRDGAGTIAVMALSIFIAHLSYQYFERPFLRLKQRFTFVAAREDDPQT